MAESKHISGLSLSAGVREAIEFSREAVLSAEQVRREWGPPATLGAPEDVKMALDQRLESDGVYTLLQHSLAMGVYGATPNFMGYGALQNIAQNGMVRACIETVSDDMTRAWIEFTQEDAEDDEPDQERLARIEQEAKRLNLQKVMHDACCLTGYYGGCLLYLDTGAVGPDLMLPLSLESWGAEASQRGFLKAVRVIDPVNCFPGNYNSIDPLRSDFYIPKTWWILGREVHASRLIRVYANEPPLLCKPAYNFLGIPQAQILWDYVAHFQKNRDSANRLMGKFSTMVFKTAITDIVTGQKKDLADLNGRIGLMAYERENDSVIAIDKDSEDIVKLETPLMGVTDVVRQSLEIIAALNRTPAVKLLGISPSGFNATGESDIRNYYDHVLSQQEKVLRPPLQRILSIIQNSLFGEVDKGLSFDFAPLSEEDEGAKVQTQGAKLNNICTALDRNIISEEEARQMLIADPDSGFDGLDPELPEDAGAEGMPEEAEGAMPMPAPGPAPAEQVPASGPAPVPAPARDGKPFAGAQDAADRRWWRKLWL